MQSKPPDNQTNVLIAITLSMAVMLGWSYFFAGPQMKAEQERLAKQHNAATQSAAPGTTPGGTTPGGTTAGGTTQPGTPAAATETQAGPAPAITREAGLAASPRVNIETPSLKGSIALKGGLIDDLSLVKHHETVNPASPNIVLFTPRSINGGYFARFGWDAVGTSVKVPNAESLWSAKTTGALTPETPAVLEWDNGAGLLFRRTIAVDKDYMFTVNDEVENKGTGDVALTPYARIFRFGAPTVPSVWIQHEGLLGVPGDAGLQEITFADAVAEPAPKVFSGKTGGWVGITDKYWASAIIPDQKARYTATLQGEAQKSAAQPPIFLAETSVEPSVIPSGGLTSVQTFLYAGAKNANIIENYGDTLGIEKFDLMIDWGWFYFLTKPMNHAVTWLYGLIGNFGFAILALTVIVKLIFYPLANKSYVSMARMKKLQPQMESLKERFKDDKPRMQQELMELYKKEKINPASGCLPILVQIPVFFALYKVLYTSIDMRHAPFVGWIKDLSAPDPTSIFNLFGLLPYAVPEFLQIGIWPIIMGATMWVQMQLNPPQPDPVQQQIFSWMPLMFTFLLGTFPAGLVIYWAWNNVLSIIQQWYISVQQGVEIHLGANFKRTFGPLLRLFSKSGETKG